MDAAVVDVKITDFQHFCHGYASFLRPGTAREYIGVWAVFIMKFKSKERVRIFEAALLMALT